MDIERIIRDYLPNVIHMSLGTCADSRPWVCEVHFAYDEDLNIYFRSKPSRRHSQEIVANPHVAGNIVEQHGNNDEPRGVYFEGRAELLQNVDENHPAYISTKDRFDKDAKIIEDSLHDDGRKFYKITVNDFYLFDARESTPAQKYHLPWKQGGNA